MIRRHDQPLAANFECLSRMPVQSCSLGAGGSGFLNHGRVSESTSSTANQNHAPHLAHRDLPAERRDTESAIRLWQRKASEVGDSPPLSTFDFTRLTSDWGYRFLISGVQFVDASVFLPYGVHFARLFGLPLDPR